MKVLLREQEVSLTTLYVSSKLHDTLKKPREILLSSYAVRFPDLLKGRREVDVASIDAKQMEADRRRVLMIERLVLETICFNFLGGRGGGEGFGLVVKIGKRMGCEYKGTMRPYNRA